MKQRPGPVVFGQVIGLIIVCALAGFTALMTFGAVGGVSMGVAPEPTFKLFGPILCGDGTELQYRSERYSYHRPGESTPFVECIRPDGSVEADVTGLAIVTVLAASFLGCFLPICVPGGLLAVVIPLFFLRQKKDPSSTAYGS